jgi:hypothetical protein
VQSCLFIFAVVARILRTGSKYAGYLRNLHRLESPVSTLHLDGWVITPTPWNYPPKD